MLSSQPFMRCAHQLHALIGGFDPRWGRKMLHSRDEYA